MNLYASKEGKNPARTSGYPRRRPWMSEGLAKASVAMQIITRKFYNTPTNGPTTSQNFSAPQLNNHTLKRAATSRCFTAASMSLNTNQIANAYLFLPHPWHVRIPGSSRRSWARSSRDHLETDASSEPPANFPPLLSDKHNNLQNSLKRLTDTLKAVLVRQLLDHSLASHQRSCGRFLHGSKTMQNWTIAATTYYHHDGATVLAPSVCIEARDPS